MNWKQLKAISATVALSMAMLATSVAQNQPAAGAAQAPAVSGNDSNMPAAGANHAWRKQALEQLNLTDQQKAQIQAIRAKAHARVLAVKGNSSLTDAQKQARIHHIRRFARRRIVHHVLTVEQRQQLRAEIHQHRQQMQQQKEQGQPNG